MTARNTIQICIHRSTMVILLKVSFVPLKLSMVYVLSSFVFALKVKLVRKISPMMDANATTIEMILIIKEPNADVCAIYK